MLAVERLALQAMHPPGPSGHDPTEEGRTKDGPPVSTATFDPTGLEPLSATDEQRAMGPLARTPQGTWVVLGHEEAMAVATDHETFSSAVSRFLQVPNGLD